MHNTFIIPFLSLLSSVLAIDCRPPGPVVPKPRALATQDLFTKATGDLVASLESAVNNTIVAGWPVENTSFSIGLITWDQPSAAIPIWEYHYLSPNNVNGTKELTRDSQYLIGSISKVFTDYILLKSGLDLDTSIVEYLPVLQNDSSLIQWGDITLRMLASQVAGIPPNCEWTCTQINVNARTNRAVRWLFRILLPEGLLCRPRISSGGGQCFSSMRRHWAE